MMWHRWLGVRDPATLDPLDQEIRKRERLFRRNGLPLLVENNSTGSQIFPMSKSTLAMSVILAALLTYNRNWSWIANLGAVSSAVLLMLGAWLALNKVRRGSWRAAPEYFGIPELVFLAVLPAMFPVVFGGYWELGVFQMAWAFLGLLGTWLFVGYGLGATIWWGFARLVGELGSSLLRLVKTLPLLLVFSLVLFYNAEVWQVFDNATPWSMNVLGGFFVALIVIPVLVRAPREARAVLEDANEAVPGSDRAVVFTRPQRVNLMSMITIGQFLQVAVVALGIWLFFIVLGMLTITVDVMALWDVDGGEWTNSYPGGDPPYALSATLMRVSSALAVFTGLYYAISIQTDPAYQEKFVEGFSTQMDRVVAARVEYLELCDRRRDRDGDQELGSTATGTSRR